MSKKYSPYIARHNEATPRPVTAPNLQVALSPAPEGWRVVPVEPTEKMKAAGFGPFLGAHDPAFSANEPCGPIWKAMISAAPLPVIGGGKDSGSDSAADEAPVSPQERHPDKLYIVVRSDLQMGKGKAIAQAIHAYRLSGAAAVMEDHTPIICVRAETEEALRLLSAEAHDLSIPCFVVRDAGHTQNAPGTFTCAAIGPAASFGPRLVASRLY